MAKQFGRGLVLAFTSGTNATSVASLKTKSVNIGNSPVDVSDDDSSGYRELMDEPGERTLNITASGVRVDDTLLAKAAGTATMNDMRLTYADGGKVDGSFFIASYAENGEYNGAVTFDMELQSSSSFTYTAPS